MKLPAGPRMSSALQSLAWDARPVPFLMRAQQRYGDVFTLRLAGEPPWVLFGSPEGAEEIVTGAPDGFLTLETNPMLGDHPLTAGEGRLPGRVLELPSLNDEQVRRSARCIRAIAQREVAAWAGGGEVRVAPRMRALALEISLGAVLGVTDAARRDALRNDLGRLLDLAGGARSFGAKGLLGKDRGSGKRRLRAVRELVDELIAQEITAHRTVAEFHERDDLLALLLQGSGVDAGLAATDADLRDELLALIITAHETGSAVSWALERLAATSDALERLRDETAAAETAYAEAVARETLRLRPIAPVVLRRLVKDRLICGHALPAGATVGASAVLVHRRPELYPDPHVFRPERFVGVQPRAFSWFPLGGGARGRIGAAFALSEFQVLLQEVVGGGQLRARSAARGGGLVRRVAAPEPAREPPAPRETAAGRDPRSAGVPAPAPVPAAPVRQRRTRKEQQARTRTNLLQAAGRVFARRGLHQASVEQIVTEAGYTKGALYGNFASKEDLFIALLEERFAERIEMVEEQTRGRGNSPTQCIVSLHADAEWERLFVEFTAHAGRDEAFRREFLTRRRALIARMASLIEQHEEPGGSVSHGSSAQLAEMMFAIAGGVTLQRTIDPELSDDFLREMLELLAQGVRARATPSTS